MTKEKRAPSIKQKRAIQAIVTGQAHTIKEAMLSAGYTLSSATKNTDLITDSNAYKEIIENYGITLPSIAKRHSELLQSTDEKVAVQAVQIGYKVHGVYDKSASNTFNAPVMIQINPPKDPRIAPYNENVSDE